MIKNKKDISYVRSSHWRCSVRKTVLKNFGNFTVKRPVLKSLFNKVADLWACFVNIIFLIFYNFLAHFLVNKFCIRQYHLKRCF